MTPYLKVFAGAFLLLAVIAAFNAAIDPYGIYQLVRSDGINWPKSEMSVDYEDHGSVKSSSMGCHRSKRRNLGRAENESGSKPLGHYSRSKRNRSWAQPLKRGESLPTD